MWQDCTVGVLWAWGAEDPREGKLPLIKWNQNEENGTDDVCSMHRRFTKCLKFMVNKPRWNGHFGKPSDQWDDNIKTYLRQLVKLCGCDSSSWGHKWPMCYCKEVVRLYVPQKGLGNNHHSQVHTLQLLYPIRIEFLWNSAGMGVSFSLVSVSTTTVSVIDTLPHGWVLWKSL